MLGLYLSSVDLCSINFYNVSAHMKSESTLYFFRFINISV